ncbi:SDR family oxidoreductase [Fretibacter rubidus]|uniref:SDR family oxidoreductase n=1 Tax=Fretibacter rubidus TaxID=570162 RepID=UPI00352A8261
MSVHAVLITGAGARVGKTLARGLASDGHAVAVHYNRSSDGAEALVQEIKDAGGQAAVVQANLFVPQDLDTLVDRAAEALGRPLTGLINNASTFADDSVRDMTRANYDYHMDINLRAPLLLSGQLAQQMVDGADGFIINMIDQRVLKPNPTFFSYSVAKSALHFATKTLAQDLAPHIRVNAVGPGPSLASVHQNEAVFRAEVAATLLQRGSPPEDLLAAVRYLISARAVTGQMIAVDGGQHLTWQTPDLMVGEKDMGDGND